MDQTADYISFLSLFGEDGTLTLRNITMPAEVCTILEQVVDDAISHKLAALPGKQAVEILNRADVFAQHVPYVQITSEGIGTFNLPACQLRLISFNDIVERLLPDIETFELFLFDKDLPSRHAYRRNLVAWRNMDAALILNYRTWLPQHVDQNQHEDKLAALLIYCRLASKAGFLTEDQVDDIVAAVDKPLPRRRSVTRAKRQ